MRMVLGRNRRIGYVSDGSREAIATGRGPTINLHPPNSRKRRCFISVAFHARLTASEFHLTFPVTPMTFLAPFRGSEKVSVFGKE